MLHGRREDRIARHCAKRRMRPWRVRGFARGRFGSVGSGLRLGGHLLRCRLDIDTGTNHGR